MRLILRVRTDQQISATVTDEKQFAAAFAVFKTQAVHKKPEEKHFLAALANRFRRGEPVEGQGVGFYTDPPNVKSTTRFGENIQFLEK